jgi:hypothetical protein
LPDTALAQAPAAKTVQYIVIENQVVLVDPTNMRVVDIINQASHPDQGRVSPAPTLLKKSVFLLDASSFRNEYIRRGWAIRRRRSRRVSARSQFAGMSSRHTGVVQMHRNCLVHGVVCTKSP